MNDGGHGAATYLYNAYQKQKAQLRFQPAVRLEQFAYQVRVVA